MKKRRNPVESFRRHVDSSTRLADVAKDLSQPVVLEEDGTPVAVLLSVAEFRRYWELTTSAPDVSASEALRAANQKVFGDLVGAALSVGEPIWVPEPSPQWRIPYRLSDGTLLRIVVVDAQTGSVLLTEEEREDLLDRVRKWGEFNDEAPSNAD